MGLCWLFNRVRGGPQKEEKYRKKKNNTPGNERKTKSNGGDGETGMGGKQEAVLSLSPISGRSEQKNHSTQNIIKDLVKMEGRQRWRFQGKKQDKTQKNFKRTRCGTKATRT